MKIKEILEIVEGELLYGEELLQNEVSTACSSDLMSDVLAQNADKQVMLTGLLNPQAIRTAEMMDMSLVIFTRGKRPTEEIIELAKDCDIAVICTKYTQFVASGKLFEQGLGKRSE